MPACILAAITALFLALVPAVAQDSAFQDSLNPSRRTACHLHLAGTKFFIRDRTTRRAGALLPWPLRHFGRSVFPRGSYLAGRLSDYEDPGRIVGKGWLKLDFGRLILPSAEIPIMGKLVWARCWRVSDLSTSCPVSVRAVQNRDRKVVGQLLTHYRQETPFSASLPHHACVQLNRLL